MEKSRIDRQFEFLLEADKEKFIQRKTLKSDGKTFENDAEHAWHMAIMCLLLGEYSNEEIDLLKTISMILIHDVVEIDAGDTYAYDDESKKSQRERELKAADRLFGLLPDDQGKKFRALWEEFEEGKTAEAKFAHTMDNVQPAMLNNSTDGKMWAKNGIKLSQILERNKNTADGSKTLWDYSYRNFINPNVKKGRIESD
ncbi:HD domain-containing protein [uncultured Ruminococcus sp.]|uniref:HD domain-containing protein n=1 Tax=uncultured Ruminococcus sp. TaxID=165186 RepID=UPI0025CED252|nr:HD domain-containing protein [uncultured Ruminococcus sp.]